MKRKTILIYVLVILGSTLFGAGIGVLAAYLRSAPSLDQVNIHQNFTTYIYDIKGRLITDLYKENRIPVDITELPDHVKNAVVAIEDDHSTIITASTLLPSVGAILVNLRDWSFSQGGGTITMQLQCISDSKEDDHAEA